MFALEQTPEILCVGSPGKGDLQEQEDRELNFYIIFESIYINLYIIQLPHSPL